MWISDKTLTCSLWPDGEQKPQKLTHYASVEFQIDFSKSCKVMEHPKANQQGNA